MALYDERQAIKQRRAAFVRNTGRRMISSAATSAVTYATCRNQSSETRRIQCLRARFYRCGLFGSLAQGLLVFLDADFKTRADAASSSSSWSILTCAGAILPPSSRLSLSDSKKAFVQISFLSQCTSRPHANRQYSAVLPLVFKAINGGANVSSDTSSGQRSVGAKALNDPASQITASQGLPQSFAWVLPGAWSGVSCFSCPQQDG